MRLLLDRSLICGLLLSSLIFSCKKSKAAKADDFIYSTEDVEQSIAGSYSAVNARIDQINIIGSAAMPLRSVLKSTTVLKLADLEADPWDSAIWSTNEIFNCFGPCEEVGHSNTPSQFVAQAINSDRQGSPMAAVQESVGILCLLSQIFDNSKGMPSAGTKTVSFNEDLRGDLASACPAVELGETDFDATVTVSDLTGTMFDKKIDFTRSGQSGSTVYIRSNDKLVNVGNFVGSADSVRRSILSYNKESKIFRFELIGMNGPGDISKILNFYRGFIDENTNEMRFTAVIGSNFKIADRWQNLSFLTVNGQFEQNEIGASISRQNAQSTFENKFICFKAENTTFVNNTGCTEDTNNNRKSSWSYTNQLFIDFAAKSPADWKMTENTGLADFDATTIFTLAPIYQ